MARRLVCSLALVLLVAAPASGSLYDRKQRLDDAGRRRSSRRPTQARAREESLRAEIASVSERIQALEAEVGDVSTRLAALEEDLALHQRSSRRSRRSTELQSERLAYLRGQYAVAQMRLADRLVAIYEGEDPPRSTSSSRRTASATRSTRSTISTRSRRRTGGSSQHVDGRARPHARAASSAPGRRRRGSPRSRVSSRSGREQQRAAYDQLLISRQRARRGAQREAGGAGRGARGRASSTRARRRSC